MWIPFVIALIVGAGLGGLVLWLRSRDIKVSWYEWLIGAMGLLMLLFTIQNYFGSIREMEPAAANMYLLIVGAPGLILLVVATGLIWRRQSATS